MDNAKLKKFISTILGSIIALLGFSSCEGNGEEMYGSPYCEFELKGKVTTESGTAVENSTITVKAGIKVENDKFEYVPYDQSAKTNGKGEYLFSTMSPVYMEKVRVVCMPPDTNILRADSTEINIVYTKDNNKNGWCVGTYSGTADFKLKSKESK